MTKIKEVFLWLSTLIGLVLLIVGGVGILNLGLRAWVFTKADSIACAYIQPVPVKGQPDPVRQLKDCQDQQTAQKQNDAAQDVALILVGAPVFLGFFKKARAKIA